jgi:hypothetical protein
MVIECKGHAECIQLAVIRLGKQHVILGYSWLLEHNPEINWETKEVRMTRCLTVHRTYRDELWAVWRNEKLAASILQQLHKGPPPSICATNLEEWHGNGGYNPADDNDLLYLCLDLDNDDNDEDELEEGDRILYTMFTLVEEIHAGSTDSQRLAEAHVRNSTPAGTEVLPWLWTSRMSSTGSLLTLCRKDRCGITPLNSFRMRSQPTARSTRSPHSNRRSSMPSL